MNNITRKLKRALFRAWLLKKGFRRTHYGNMKDDGSYSETWKGELGLCHMQWSGRQKKR